MNLKPPPKLKDLSMLFTNFKKCLRNLLFTIQATRVKKKSFHLLEQPKNHFNFVNVGDLSEF